MPYSESPACPSPTSLCVLSHFTMCIFPLHNVPFPASLYDSLPGSPCDLSYFIIHLFPLHQMPFPTSTCVFYLLYHVPFPLQHVLISHFSRCHFPLSILLFCIAYLLPTALPIPNIEVNSILSGRSNYISPLWTDHTKIITWALKYLSHALINGIIVRWLY